jgi:hypothetical protein
MRLVSTPVRIRWTIPLSVIADPSWVLNSHKRLGPRKRKFSADVFGGKRRIKSRRGEKCEIKRKEESGEYLLENILPRYSLKKEYRQMSLGENLKIRTIKRGKNYFKNLLKMVKKGQKDAAGVKIGGGKNTVF